MSFESRLLFRLCMVAVLAILGAIFGPARASEPSGIEGNICDQAAYLAAQSSSVPLPVLLAVTRTETSRAGTPWPWTVNMEGAGHWFNSRSEAEQFALQHQARGARSFDIGCFQINHRWHGQHFQSVPDMFEPMANARYAARFLSQLFQELGSWDAAVGAYHSRTPRYASRYLRQYHGHLAALNVAPDMRAQESAPVEPATRENTYSLLRAGTGPSATGSLVPLDQVPARPLFGARP